MKILFVITSLKVGGAEVVVTNLADSFANKGHDVQIVFLKGNAFVRPDASSVCVTGLEVDSFFSMLLAILKLKKIISIFNPDVVHSHMFHANILARLVRIFKPFPKLISNSHNVFEGGRFRMLIYRLTDRYVDLSCNVSDEAVASLIKNGATKPGRMITVHNGIKTNQFFFCPSARREIRNDLGVADNCKMILSVGSLSRQKDYPNLFRALQLVNPTGIAYRLFIAGDGPLKNELSNIVHQLGIESQVEFLGVRSDIPRLLSAADLFVLPSAWEGFGLVVAEAMACERVVVATDCGGVSEVLGNEGYLVQPQNPEALGNAILAALALSPVQSSAMGRSARQRVCSLYSLDAAVDKWLKIYFDK